MSALVLATSAQASTIEHKNCEVFLNSKVSRDFFNLLNISPNDFAFALEAKGYQAITYISQPTLDGHTPMSGNQDEDLLSGDLRSEVAENGKTVKASFALTNNKKDCNGKVISSEELYAETITERKRFFQSRRALRIETGTDLIRDIPD